MQQSIDLVSPHWRTWEPGGFIQDDWHATQNLTLNIGVRYDVFTPFTEVKNALSNFDLATGQIVTANQKASAAVPAVPAMGVNPAIPGSPARPAVNQYAGLNPTWTNVAPRLGFAFSPGTGFVIRGGYGMSYFPENYTSNSSLKAQPFVADYNCNNGACATAAGADGVLFSPTRFSQGLPLPTPSSATNPTGSISDVVDPKFRTSYAEQFNLNIEKTLGANVLQVGYVGVLGRHLAQISNDINAPALVSNSTLNNMALVNHETTSQAYNSLRPYYSSPGLQGVTSIGQYTSEGSSSYHALQVQLTRRTTAGLTIGANYTYAHALDNVLGFSNEVNDGYGALPSQLTTVEYGNSDLDIRQRGVVTGDYLLPFGKNLTGIGAALGKGWQANTLLVWQTGQPFTVTESNGVSGTTNASTTGRPNQIARADVGTRTINQFFNPAAFAPQLSGTLGNEQRNPLHGPNYRRVDFSVFKSFPVYRESTLQFRAECFNVVNTTNFNNPNATIQTTPTSSSVAYPVAGTSSQQTFLSDTYAVTPSNAGSITSTASGYIPREFQFALKYQF